MHRRKGKEIWWLDSTVSVSPFFCPSGNFLLPLTPRPYLPIPGSRIQSLTQWLNSKFKIPRDMQSLSWGLYMNFVLWQYHYPSSYTVKIMDKCLDHHHTLVFHFTTIHTHICTHSYKEHWLKKKKERTLVMTALAVHLYSHISIFTWLSTPMYKNITYI